MFVAKLGKVWEGAAAESFVASLPVAPGRNVAFYTVGGGSCPRWCKLLRRMYAKSPPLVQSAEDGVAVLYSFCVFLAQKVGGKGLQNP